MHKNKYYHRNDHAARSLLSLICIIAGGLILGYVLLHLLYWVFLTIVGGGLLFAGMRLRRPFPYWFSRF